VYEVPLDEFEAIVVEALRGLPPAFRERIANLDVGVEEWARPEDYDRTEAPQGSTLLAVYRGVPLTRRGAYYNMALPDRIAIFRQPLQRIARDGADLRERVAHVVRHEVAHYFGISDERLREIDAY
jgi:predicted Zn-dependent protease with MMP-like domain